jgi:ArsR family transcriptional regulator, arsenate/arsenite/antimonite-responsive transcriptional repressor
MDSIAAPTIRLDLAVRRFAALSDPTRLRIVELLTAGEWCVCDLQVELEAAQSRLSFHLKKLKEAGIVEDRRAGRWSYYSLNGEALEEMVAFLQAREPSEHRSGCGCSGCC